MDRDTIIEVTQKLTGRCFPYGDTRIDEERYENLSLKIAVASSLINEVYEAGKLYNRHEYSIQNISNRANQYLTELRDMLCEIDYLPPIEPIAESEDCISRAEALDEFKKDYDDVFDLMTSIEELPSVTPTEPKPVMTEEVREALMRLTMCAREECTTCKYENDCGFDEQVEMATENMHTILNAFDTTDMAIEALKAEPIRCGECENYIDRRCIKANHHVAAHENCMEVFGAKKGGDTE